MLVRHYAGGKWHRVACPAGSRVERGPVDHLVVTFDGEAVPIPAEPAGLLPLLAESGRFGLALVGLPEPDARLAGASCPGCGQADTEWLALDDETETVRCDVSVR